MMTAEKTCFDFYTLAEKREELGEGPWLNEPDAVLWRSDHCAFPCVLVRCPANLTWVGGIAVPPQHSLWGLDAPPFGAKRFLFVFVGEIGEDDLEFFLPLKSFCSPMRLCDLWWYFVGQRGFSFDARLGLDDEQKSQFRREYIPAENMVRLLEMLCERHFATHWRGPIEHHWTLTASAVRERGWTEEMISEFLGEPDERKPNPKYHSPYPMRLYLKKRVLAAERRMKVARRLGRVEPDYSWWHFDPDERPGWIQCLPLGRQDIEQQQETA